MKKVLGLKILAVVCVIVSMVTLFCTNTALHVRAAGISADYPAVLLRISTHDNSRHLNISGYDDKSKVVASELKNTLNESWRFDYTGTDSKGSFYRITNMGTGRVLTPESYNVSEGTACMIFGNENAKSQFWYVVPVDKDSYGTDLHFKIVNYENTSLALTNSSNKIVLSSYSGKNEQKWLLNAVGEQGFAGYCKDSNGKVKACNIGGALGKVVEVQTFDQLKSACTSTEPCTIVITKNINKTGSYTKDSNGRYRFNDAKIYMQSNKTVIGSYAAHSLYNVYFNTYNKSYGPGHDLIFRNIQISHDKELNNDNIWEFSYGYNFWIDHIEFVGHDKVNGASTKTDDWDKFLNFKGNTDNDNTDFITVSDCKFGLHEYGVLLGYPVDTQEAYNTFVGTPHVTIANNFYNKCITRAPALMRYGYFHSFNNYVVNFDMGYTIYTACKLYAENNYYNAGTGKGSVVNDTVSSSDISSKYPGQYTEVGSTLTGSKYTLSGKTAKACSWRPNSNYSYTAKSAADAKAYCEKYSGPQSSASNMTYATLNKSGYPSAGFVVAPSVSMDEPVLTPPVEFSGNVYLVGDSTVCDYDDNYSNPYDRYGWGMKFAEQFSGVNVHNLALSGRSSRSFLSEQNYQTLKNSLGKGDYLFIQFGHNDEKSDESQYPGLGTYTGLDWNTLDNTGKDSQGRYSYEYILAGYYINLAKNKGAVPVLVTPITRRAADGQANYQQHTPYQQAMKQLGETFDVAVIDMTALTTQLYTNLYNYGGASETAKMHCYTDTARTTFDNTHLSNAGAYKIASMIAEQTEKLGLSISKNIKSKVNSAVYPELSNIEYNVQYHQIRFTWKPVSGATNYGIAVYLAGKWRIQASDISASTTTYTTPKNLTPGKSYKVAIAAKVNGEWTAAEAIGHAVTVSVK